MHRNPRALLRTAASLLRAATPTAQTLTSHSAPPKPHLRLPLPASFSGRGFCGYSKELDEVNRKFAEAREEIEAAMESKETVYFNEEAACAREAAAEALGSFDGLLARLPAADAEALRRSMGLKMEQLKAELKQLDE